MRFIGLILLISLSSSAVADGLQRDIVFSEYSPLTRSGEIARRILSPLADLQITRALGEPALRRQTVDLTRESFSIYVPPTRPERGYGLLVFIPPWQDSRVPAGWAAVLDELGVIFVSAAKSGNDESILDRRIPLALAAAFNIAQRYAIDAQRIYIAGFSGGSRVALRAALAYPDLFRGAILNAGSDAIGDREAYLPAAELFSRFQASSRLVYVTGSKDDWNIEHDMGSRNSLNHWCVFGATASNMSGVGHEVAPPYFLRLAVNELDSPASIDADKLSACRNRIAKELADDLKQTSELLARDKSRQAQRSLHKLDVRYGSLAAPEIIELEQRMETR